MNFLGMGPMELLLILILALIIFGPHRLPEMMGQLGKAFRDFQRTTSQLSDEFNRTLQTELAETKAVIEETKAVVQETRSAVTEATSLTRSTLTAAPQLTTPAPKPETVATEPMNGQAEPAPVEAAPSWSWETPVQEPPPGVAAVPPAEEPADQPAESGRTLKGEEASTVGDHPPSRGDDPLLPPY